MKRLLLLIFSLILTLVCQASIKFTYNGFDCETKSDGTVKIKKYNGTDISVFFPSFVSDGTNTYHVTEIDAGQSLSTISSSNTTVEEIYIPSEIQSLTRVTRNLKPLKTIVIEDGTNLTVSSPFMYSDAFYSTSIQLDNIICLTPCAHTSEDLIANAFPERLLKTGEIKVYFSDGEIGTIQMYIYDKFASHMSFGSTRFKYLLSALQKGGKDISTIEKIDLSGMPILPNSPSYSISFKFDSENYNPASELSNNAEVIISKSIKYIAPNTLSVTDKEDFTAPTADITGTINYTRSNTLNWNSVCLPFDIKESDFGGNSKIYEVTSASSDAITLSRVATSETTIPAGTPCFIKSTDEQWNLTISDATISSSVSAQTITVGNYQVVGSFELKTIGANKYKLTADGSKFGITNKNDATVTPFRCYIIPPSSSNAPAFINVNFDEEATITLVPNDAEPQKVKLYDLMGRPRKEATPGIFIKSTR